jgi:hypothetical protein
LNKQPLPSNSWVSNLSPEQQKEFRERLLEAKDLFQRLFELVEVKVETNSSERRRKSTYDKPAWSEFQADSNGYERALTEIKELLKFTKE